MIAKFTFPLPPTLNEQIRLARGSWQASARVKVEWTNKIAALAWGGHKFKDKVWIAFEWRVKRYTSDFDNVSAASKYVCDGLVTAGILKDDSLAIVQSPVVHSYSKTGKNEEPVVVVTISDNLEDILTVLLAQVELDAQSLYLSNSDKIL